MLPNVVLNQHWTGFRCTVCDRAYPVEFDSMVCAECGVDGILDVVYDYNAIGDTINREDPFPAGGTRDLWRFAPLLPMHPQKYHPAWSVGGTPLHAPQELRNKTDLPYLHLKDDTSLPSASLKDRASAMAIVDAVRRGISHIACASTGNAAASLSVLAARAGISCTIFVPANAPEAKLAQLLLHGADVIRVDGTYDDAFDLSIREINTHNWYSRNCAYNPLLVEGKKTAALEFILQLGLKLPDVIFVPTGDGCIVSSIAKALRELFEICLIDKLPKVFGVQAEGASPLTTAWQNHANHSDMNGQEILKLIPSMTPDTLADSIAVGTPRNRIKAWKRVSATGGGFVSVSDNQILEAIHLLASKAGVFAEPSGAAGFAGVLKAREKGLITGEERIVVMVTGHGLKDPGAALSKVTVPDPTSL